MTLIKFFVGSLILLSSSQVLAREQASTAIVQGQFFHQLHALCGARFEGAMTFPNTGLDDFAGKVLVATIGQCSESELRIPFSVGVDQSRTWVLRLTGANLQLQHDHRHADGTPDPVTLYGGIADNSGSALQQSFPADAYTAELIPAARTNVWTIGFSSDLKTLRYELQRDGKPRFAAELHKVGNAH